MIIKKRNAGDRTKFRIIGIADGHPVVAVDREGTSDTEAPDGVETYAIVLTFDDDTVEYSNGVAAQLRIEMTVDEAKVLHARLGTRLRG